MTSETLQKAMTGALRGMLTEQMQAPEYQHQWKEWPMVQGGPVPALRGNSRRKKAANAPDPTTGWTSPRATDVGRVRSQEAIEKAQQKGGSKALEDDAQLALFGWPTPAANEYEPTDLERMKERREQCKETTTAGNGFGLTLGMAAPLWCSASTSEASSPSSDSESKDSGRRETTPSVPPSPPLMLAGWTTPQANEPDSAERPSREQTGRTTEYLGRQVQETLTGWPTPQAADAERASEQQVRGENNPTLLGAARLTQEQPSLSGWPTPRTEDGEGGLRSSEGAEKEFERRGQGADLPTIATLTGWATPTAGDAQKKKPFPDAPQPALAYQAHLSGWQTPTVTDATGRDYVYPSGDHDKPFLTLPGQAMLTQDLAGWPTPNVPNGGRLAAEDSMTSTGMTPDGTKRQVDLNFVAQLAGWPTAQARDGDSRGATADRATGERMNLDDYAQLAGWTTPTATDDKHCEHRDRIKGEPLRGQANLASMPPWIPCPCCDNYHCTKHRMHAHECPCPEIGEWRPDPYSNPGATPSSSPAATARPAGLRLNPGFSLWLMGIPALEWSTCSPGWPSWVTIQRLLAESSARPEPTGADA